MLRASKLFFAGVFVLAGLLVWLGPARVASAQSSTGGNSYIGLLLRDVTPETAHAAKLDSDRGVEVVRVQDGSPAERAGLRAGDILLSYNGEPILGQLQVRRLVSETPPARKVKLEFWRDGKVQTTVVLTGVLRLSGSLDAGNPDMVFTVPGAIPLALLAWKVPMLGLECEPLTLQLADFFGVKHGVLIRSIDADSSAEKAGLRAGDVLMSIGNQPVNSARDLMAFVRSNHELGKPTLLIYVRGRKELTAKFNAFPDIP